MQNKRFNINVVKIGMHEDTFLPLRLGDSSLTHSTASPPLRITVAFFYSSNNKHPGNATHH